MDEPSNEQVDRGWRDAELAEAVMEYLVEFPEAMDTLKGIAEWWVMRQRVRVDVEMLASVLRRLTEQGFLEESQSASGVRYRLKT